MGLARKWVFRPWCLFLLLLFFAPPLEPPLSSFGDRGKLLAARGWQAKENEDELVSLRSDVSAKSNNNIYMVYSIIFYSYWQWVGA